MATYLGKNLVVLQYSPNTCYTQLVDKIPNEIQLDLKAGAWSYKDKTRNHPEGYKGIDGFKIGTQRRYCNYGCRGGVIGIYDRTDLRHLNSMLGAAKDATADRPGAWD